MTLKRKNQWKYLWKLSFCIQNDKTIKHTLYLLKMELNIKLSKLDIIFDYCQFVVFVIVYLTNRGTEQKSEKHKTIFLLFLYAVSAKQWGCDLQILLQTLKGKRINILTGVMELTKQCFIISNQFQAGINVVQTWVHQLSLSSSLHPVGSQAWRDIS